MHNASHLIRKLERHILAIIASNEDAFSEFTRIMFVADLPQSGFEKLRAPGGNDTNPVKGFPS